MSISYAVFCLKMPPRPPPSTLFPYTTLFRSRTGFSDQPGCLVPIMRHYGSVPGALQDHAQGVGYRGLVISYKNGFDPFCHCAPSLILVSLQRSEEHTSELQSHVNLVCRLLLENAPAPPPIYPLSLHDALPISDRLLGSAGLPRAHHAPLWFGTRRSPGSCARCWLPWARHQL